MKLLPSLLVLGAISVSPATSSSSCETQAALTTDDNSTSTTPPTVIDALFDGSCFYPKPDTLNFNLTVYLGRWYQVAGTFAPFTAGCSCIFANYSLNATDGSVNVFNACQRGTQASNITGKAVPVDPAYGETGVYKVEFPFGSGPNECPGPNYIVQDYSYDGQWALVQASNFSTLFVLSRQQNPGRPAIETWLARAERRGSNLDQVIFTNQTGCLYT